jgi:hypothetical protein
MSEISAFGITAALPPGWDGRITRRPDPRAAPVPPEGGVGPLADTDAQAAPSPLPTPGDPGTDPPVDPLAQGTENPVAHLANFALPAIRGDYGSGAVERMGPRDILVCLVEFDPEASGTALFATAGIPRFRIGDFAPHTMQRTIAGMCGAQAFFTVAGRAFSAYAVLGTFRLRAPLVAEVNRLLAGMEIAPR